MLPRLQEGISTPRGGGVGSGVGRAPAITEGPCGAGASLREEGLAGQGSPAVSGLRGSRGDPAGSLRLHVLLANVTV